MALPFSLRLDRIGQQSGTIARSIDQQPCGICGRQFAKYTCPLCNKPYCSLVCYRSESHSQCTEPFYRREVEDDIRATPSRTVEEKRAMMEMLKRFEEQSAETDEGEEDSDDEGTNDLAEKLKDMDLDSATPEMLWSALSEQQQEEFSRAMRDPNGDLARALLASESVLDDITQPWWQQSQDEENDGADVRIGKVPTMIQLPATLLNPSGPKSARSLLYNVLAIALAYAYVTRRTSSSPLASSEVREYSVEEVPLEDSRSMFLRLAIFLKDRRSTTVFGTVEEALTDVWSRFEANEATPDLFALILRDAAALLRPSHVTVLSEDPNDLDSHPARNALLMLSDLHTLFDLQDKRYKAVALKLQFYVAHVVTLPSAALEMASNAAMHAAQEQERKADLETPADQPAVGQGLRLTAKELMGRPAKKEQQIQELT